MGSICSDAKYYFFKKFDYIESNNKKSIIPTIF